MKKIIKLTLGFLMCILVLSCKKQPIGLEIGQMEMQFTTSSLKSILHSDTLPTTTLASLIVSVEDFSGTVIKNVEKVELYSMNGSYISKPISLPKGSYKLTGFLVLDWQNNVVYVSPVKGSPKAYLVANPLPLSFTVQTNVVTKVAPEVLNSAGTKPEDFGYATFSFNVAQTFDFLVGTFIYDSSIKNYKLTSSRISIYTDTVTSTPSNALVNIYDSLGVTNKITLPERFNKYFLVISKAGFKTYNQTFTKEELKLHLRSADKGPLVVLLEESSLNNGLVAYYKFNGDVLDYSGSNNNGIYYGRKVYGSGNKSDANGAIDLNGSSDYVTVKNTESLNPTTGITVAAWVRPGNFVGSGNDAIVDKPYTSHVAPHYQYHLGIAGNYPGPNTYGFSFNICINNQNRGVGTKGYAWLPNKWYFVLGSYDGEKVRFYLNGSCIDSLAIKAPINTFNTDLNIGKFGNINYYVPGSVDEVRIYNRSLTRGEILSLYQQ